MRAIIKTHNALNGIAGSTEGVHTSAAERAYLQNADAANGVVLLDESGSITAGKISPEVGRLLPLVSTHNTDIVPVNAFGTADAWESGSSVPTRTFLLGNHQHRIRQSGTVSKVEIEMDSIADLVSMQFVVYRWNGSTYDAVNASEAIPDSSFSPGANTLTLSTPITGVQRGDFPGFVIVTDANTEPELVGTINNAVAGLDFDVLYEDGDHSAATGWTPGGGTLVGYSINMSFQMTAPLWCAIGDSIMEGADGSRSYLNPITVSWETLDPESSMPGYLADYSAEFFDYQNNAKGGSTAQQWAAEGSDYVASRCTVYKPKYALVSLGWNDQAGGRTVAQIATDVESVLDSLDTAGVTPVMITIPQTQGGTAEQNATIRAINDSHRAICKERSIVLVDYWALLADGDDNDTRLVSLYGGGAHPYSIAYRTIAKAIYDRMVV